MSDFERHYLLALVLVAYSLLCAYCVWRYRAGLLALGVKGKISSTEIAAKPTFLVAYASQSGTAADLAQRSAELLGGQTDFQILPLNKVDNDVLSYTRQALFVVSTYGEGEPPDNGLAFATRYLNGTAATDLIDLSHLQFSVLALGDKLYQQFCAFGHNVHQGLTRLGAMPLLDPLEACASEGFDSEGLLQQLTQGWAQQRRQTQAQPLFQQDTAQGVRAPNSSDMAVTVLAKSREFAPWRLLSRTHINPGSPGAPVFHVCLTQTEYLPLQWQAGDLIEVAFNTMPNEVRQNERMPEHLFNTQVKRKYSIASLSTDGVVELIVRRHINDDGSLGIGSGWLTAKAPLEANISLRICENPQFHAVEAQRAMILIGSGTGLAGLRAHIKQRAQQGATCNWLLFGERSPEHDGLCADEINAWHQSGILKRVDLAFSRDSDNPTYVQDIMLKQANELKLWLQNGAAVYVCGNRTGMAQGVDQALQQILDADSYQQLQTSGHYRRDIY
jgi:sulfite reductase (NADPH) flavoprotein alpha-component